MKLFRMFVTLAPMLIQMVAAAEGAIPQKGQGPTKLAMVLDTTQHVIESSAESAAIVAGTDWKKPATAIINTAVAAANVAGAFSK